MTNTRDVILKLKEVREEKGLSYGDILKLMEKNGEKYLPSKSTLSKLFSEGSEEQSFKYEETIRPIANALLDMETIEDDDETDVKAMKAVLKYKAQRIEELERQVERLEADIEKEKNKTHEKLEKQRAEMQSKIDLLEQQIARKDRRIDQLFGMYDYLQGQFHAKDKLYTELVQRCMG